MTHFTTREVAKILDLSPARIRSCVSAGLVAPARGAGRELQFSFQDLLLLRTTKGLLDSRVPLPRIRRLVASLKRQLPEDRQLSSLTIYADGRRVVAWDGSARWQPDSGQFLFNFDVQAVAKAAVVEVAAPPLTRPAPAAKRTLTAEQWYNLGCELEATSPEEARRAYHQALELDPGMSDAHVNLGRLYQEAGESQKAEAHYRAAVKHAPGDPVAWFNLGVLLEEQGRREEAVQAYRRAVGSDPDFAAAHYNLGLLLEALGRRSEAIGHLRTARTLYGRAGR
ncbi:MAG TPA: tetratricopeptide repeat protein [Methylomirabilota bacterium]|nr:tetratricopeptide repeat protein [Methylomirabilota bacterium]